MNEARASAHELTQVGRLLNDPRSTGFGLGLLAFVALVSVWSQSLRGIETLPLSAKAAPLCCFDRLKRERSC